MTSIAAIPGDPPTVEMTRVQRIVDKVLRPNLPVKYKRMIFIATLLGALTGSKMNATKELTDKINRVLGLAHNSDALAFPMYVSRVVWGKDITHSEVVLSNGVVPFRSVFNSKLSGDDLNRLADYLLAKAPQWVAYGSGAIIAKDLENVQAAIKAIPGLGIGV